MKRTLINTAVILATLPAGTAFAAALDRSGQPMGVFFQEGNYVEAGISYLDPKVTGKEANNTLQANGTTASRDVPDMAKSYTFGAAAVKLQPHEKLSLALIYDEPFGANVDYTGSNNKFVNDATSTYIKNGTVGAIAQGAGARAQQAALAQGAPAAQAAAIAAGTTAAVRQGLSTTSDGNDHTRVHVRTHNLSFIAGYQPTKNWNIYGGPVYQTLEGSVNLRGTAYSVYNGYDANFDRTGAFGYLVGAAYSKPEIALRAAITYRSKIKHDVRTTENFGIASLGNTEITTPQSVNIDLQSGVAENTLAFANLRWVDWSSFSIAPSEFSQVSKVIGPLAGKPNGFNLIAYDKDQYSATVGVARKFNDQWTASASVGWDSGTGSYASTLGPTKGYWSLGVGAQYSPVKNLYISGGVRYFWLGNAKAQTGAQFGTEGYVADFSSNRAVGIGAKVGYRF